jgi:hypothetical protein
MGVAEALAALPAVAPDHGSAVLLDLLIDTKVKIPTMDST